MTTYDAGDVTLEKVRDYVWELPQTGEMRVPARVLASEALLAEISEDKTLQQLRNTTHLPGIQKHAICMPDGHQGYGFPVGGVAAIDAENGCISPGAVGYDINCLSAETSVRLSHGRHIDIADLESRFESEGALVSGAEGLVESPIRLFTASGQETVYEVVTETGQRIEATGDHPIRTPEGMAELDSLEPGDEVLVQPFEGIEHEDPADVTLLTAEDFSEDDPQLVRVLAQRDILPLSTADETFNRLLKILGFFTGDGSVGEAGQPWFDGELPGLEQLGSDIEEIGFTPSKISSRDRPHDANGTRFDATEARVTWTAKAFRRLLEELGAPVGPTVEAGYTTPWYFEHLTDWQRALYYRAYFGAEMSAPAAGHDRRLSCPNVSQHRTGDTVDEGRAWLEDLATFLEALGIETNELEEFETDAKASASMRRLRLGVKNDAENLIQFFSTVGYGYNRTKQRRAVQAIQYLRRQERANERRASMAADTRAMADGGVTVREVTDSFDRPDRDGERSGRSGRRGCPRPGEEFPGFEAFRETCSVDESLSVRTEIAAIEDAGERPVYDIGVEHDAHNFLANGFVVSNCGVRMVKTDLTYDDLRGREEELVDQLFANVPSGLGGGGVFEGSKGDMEAILSRGMDWALEHGYAVEDDLEHCEDEGYRPEADPDKVSQKAKDRGKNQVGSLGSGNHFLEVQRVTDVYRADVAADFGLAEDQVVVLIHCGSRGLGHQVCTDYLRDVEQTHAGLLEQLPDKELAAAPAGSQLAEDYYRAMCAAINFAWVNRQLVMHQTRRVFEKVFGRDWEDLGMALLYDVAHNIAKRETHDVGGEEAEVFVHRKGATRAFPAGHPEVPAAYRDVGQPIIIPGSMGAGSYVLRGGEHSLAETFGSTAHGAGRLMSRTQAKNEYWGEDVMDDLRDQQHIYVKAQSGATVAEEAPGVYKDVDEVVRVSDALGIGDRVARTFPVCNIKG